MMRLRIAQSAEADLLAGFAFYEGQQSGIGSYFLDSLCADIDSLLLYAGVHPKPYGHLHRMLAKLFLLPSITSRKATWSRSWPYWIADRILRR